MSVQNLVEVEAAERREQEACEPDNRDRPLLGSEVPIGPRLVRHQAQQAFIRHKQHRGSSSTRMAVEYLTVMALVMTFLKAATMRLRVPANLSEQAPGGRWRIM